MQTKLGSFVEAWANVAIGFTVSFASNLVILPHYGCPFSFRGFFEIGIFFTIISVIRSYYVRRLFNWIKFGNVRGEENGR